MNTEWKLVPKHATKAMQDAWDSAPSNEDTDVEFHGAYAAMLAAAPAAPTSHPIPTGATEDRDWELSCDECNGSGHVFVKHQVAERKTDVQEFKEECEACEGRGFNIAFEDIPGIAEYVKSCRPAPAAGDALDVLKTLEKVRALISPVKTDKDTVLGAKALRDLKSAEAKLAAAIAQQKGEA